MVFRLCIDSSTSREATAIPLDVILILLDWDDPFGHEKTEFCEFAFRNNAPSFVHMG